MQLLLMLIMLKSVAIGGKNRLIVLSMNVFKWESVSELRNSGIGPSLLLYNAQNFQVLMLISMLLIPDIWSITSYYVCHDSSVG